VAFIAVLDACVLVNAPVRDTLLRAAEEDLYRPAFMLQILEEMGSALERNLEKTPEQTSRLTQAIVESFEGALVTVYEALIPVMTNHESDRHVLAAAVKEGAGAIITFNLRHFPPAACAPFGIEVQHPDDFLQSLLGLDEPLMFRILREQAADIDHPLPWVLNALQPHVPDFVRLVSGLSLDRRQR
jgi:hypothetical protein